MAFGTPKDHIWGNWSLSNTVVDDGKLKLAGSGGGPAWGDVVLWHKFDDSGNSGIGPNPTVYGTPTFLPAKFTDGIDNSETATDRLGFDISGLANNVVGGCGFWIKHTNASTAAGNNETFFGHNVPSSGSTLNITVGWESQTYKIIFNVYVGGTRVAYLYPSHTWGAGDLEYWEFYWNGGGSAGTQGNKVAMYVDGVEITSFTWTASNGSWTASWTSADLLFCMDNIKGTSRWGIDGEIIDNYMLFDTTTPRTSTQRDEEDPTGGGYESSGTATTIVDMGDLRRLNRLALIYSAPTNTTLTLKTRTSDTAPTGAAQGQFLDDQEYRYHYYNGWGTTDNLSTYADMIDLTRYTNSERTARYIEFKFSLATSDTDYTPEVTSLTNYILDYFNMGEFDVGAPSFSTSKGKNVATVTCYDIMKKLLDKKVTTREYAGTEKISDMIEHTLVEAGLNENQYDIDETTFTVVTSNGDPLYADTSVKDILNYALEYLQIEAYPNSSDYRVFYKDSKLQMKMVPTELEPDFGLWERYHLLNATRVIDDDLRFSRVTVYNQSNDLGPEVDFDDVDGSTTGTKTLSHSGTWVNLISIVDTTGDFVVIETDREIGVGGNTTLTFEVTGSSGTYDIEVRGCPINSPAGHIAEWAGDGTNQREARGRAYSLTNEFIQSKAQAENMAKFLFGYHDDPLFKMTVKLNAVPQLELNDNILLFGEKISCTNLLVLQSIGMDFSPKTASFKQTLELVDNSVPITSFVWDRNGWDETPPHGAPDITHDLKFDTSLPWDFDIGATATEDDNEYPIPILFS